MLQVNYPQPNYIYQINIVEQRAWYSQLQLIRHHQNSGKLNYLNCQITSLLFNIGSQWSVSREIVRIKHSAKLSGRQIKRSQVYINGHLDSISSDHMVCNDLLKFNANTTAKKNDGKSRNI